ncbi:MAG: hypothetical protein QME14_06690 [Methanobacteriaceae archaeon]|nr:hypothetical protein [Methanobacteriaceae archaeon]
MLDFLTTGGIPLFYPFSITRFSAEIYSYVDPFITVAALIVLATIYFQIDIRYKKAAMIIFMIMLVSFGGIRLYEKNNAFNAFKPDLNENFTEISTYPTSNMFLWRVVVSDHDKGEYRLYENDGLSGKKKFLGEYRSLSVENGSYESALIAVKDANQLLEVQEFKWHAFYMCIDAQYQNNKWKLTYYDFIGSYSTRENLTIYID